MNDPGLRGVATLLRENSNYRRLWLAQVVSQAGDWINQIAVVTLLIEMTGLGTAVGYSLILRMLPGIFVTPFAGVLIDRFDRKRILIASDLLRGLVVPGFIFVDSIHQVGWVYTLVVIQVSLSSFFEPARSAVIPSICRGDELLSASALSSMTWSLMLALGSAVGGVLIALVGLDAAFMIDAGSFFVSAFFISRMEIPSRVGRSFRSVLDVGRDLVGGVAYIAKDSAIRSLVLVKSGVGLAGGMVLLLSVLGEGEFSIGEGASLGIGVLFFSRGIGTAIGPFVGRALSGYDEPAMRRLIGFGFVQGGCLLILFGQASSIWLAAPLLILSHIGTSINWVFSTVLLQLRVEDEMRGRVFAVEMLLFTLVFCVMTRVTGHALDVEGLPPRRLVMLAGGLLCLPGLAWLALGNRSRRPSL